MKVTEEALLESGFSPAELQKLKNNIANYGGTLDSVTHDLANRFKASKWISVIALTILVITIMLTSFDASESFAATLTVVLPFLWYITPAKLAYKAWHYRKSILI